MTFPRTRRQILAALALVAVTAVWGATFIMVKWTVAATEVYHFLFLRFLLAFAGLALFFPKRVFVPGRGTLRAAAVLGFFMGLAYVTQTEGLRLTSAGNSALITGLYIVIVPALSALFCIRRPSPWSVGGALLSLLGLYLLTTGSLSGFNLGDGLTLVTALAWAFHIFYTGRYAQGHGMVPLVAWQFLLIALFALALSLIKGSVGDPIPAIGWWTILATAIPASALGFVLQVAAQRVIDPTRTGVIFALEAPFGLFFSWWIGGEGLTPVAFGGALAMVAGMMLSEIMHWRKSAKAFVS